MERYILKQSPEDFVVREMPLVQPGGTGESTYFLMKKRNYTTQDAIGRVAVVIRRNPKEIGFSGTKDRVAVTEQLISFRGENSAFSHTEKDLSVTFYGHGPHLHLGDLAGNSFIITIRGLETAPRPTSCFVNLFGEQRFSANNHVIGKLLVQKRFKDAAALLLEGEGRFEKTMREYLESRPTDFIGAIRTIPKPIGILFVHAYQSHLWNMLAEKISGITKEDIQIPIIGFGTDLSGYKHAELVSALLREEGVNVRDFIIRGIPGFTFEGTWRDLFAQINNLEIGPLSDDELISGKKKCVVSFSLGKGSYATIAIRSLLS